MKTTLTLSLALPLVAMGLGCVESGTTTSMGHLPPPSPPTEVSTATHPTGMTPTTPLPAPPAPATAPPAPTAAPPAPPDTSSAPPASPGASLNLETRTHEAFQISIPKGAKPPEPGLRTKGVTLETYEYPLDDRKVNGINISVATAINVASLADAVRDASLAGKKDIAVQRELEKGSFLVVKAPEGSASLTSQEVYVYRRGKDGWLKAKCTGPAEQKDKLIEICSSLKPR